MLRARFWIGILLLSLSGCISPYRTKTAIDPSFDACRYKTYAFMTPVDETLNKWLSDPQHRQILEDLVRKPLGEKGLTEAPAGSQSADLWVRQRLHSSYNSATKTAEGVAMASDYKFGKLTVELATAQDAASIFSVDMSAVIGDLEGRNITNAKTGLHRGFQDYPPCRKK